MGLLLCSHIFTDNMVLQRRKNIKIWGFAQDGAEVIAHINGVSSDTIVKDNKWTIIIPPMEAGGPYILVVTDSYGNRLEFNNVMIGDVWLAGGQSNMELELQHSLDGKETLENIAGTDVRYFYVKKNAYIDELFYIDERNNKWMEATPESATIWSAVAFHFAKKVSEATGVTIGVIGCNWGGTSASNWMSRDLLESDADTYQYIEDYEKAMEGKTFEQYCRELDEYKAWYKDWQPKIDDFFRANPDASWQEAQENVGESKWPGPIGPKSEYRPSGLYQTMFKRIIPYAITGVIYYQGESDDHRPFSYYKLMRNLIEQWRNDFENDKLPFIFVQLPMHIDKGVEDKKNWCLIRESQMRVHQTVANTGIAVAIDCGEFNNIHPVDKKTVGDRLALQALYHVYNMITMDEAYGPVYKSYEYREGALLLSFDFASSGFITRDGKTAGFEIAGADKVYYSADASIMGNQILISSPKVKRPKYARYLWTNYSNVYIFGKNGLPLAPFRTSTKDY